MLPTFFLLTHQFSFFMMTYDQQILRLLTIAGDRGLSVSSITKHVYNQNSTFFSSPDLQEVKAYVQQYLLRNSKSPQSLIQHTDRRGYYRLNANSADARQLMLDFREETVEEQKQETEKRQQDLSLDLFSDMF